MIDKKPTGTEMFHMEHRAHRNPARPVGRLCGDPGGVQPEGQSDCYHRPEGIEDKHFLDSLLFASQPEVAGKMVDVGAGAGFPGIVTKIFKPELELTLMEPTGKRVEFLKYACGQLGLTGVEFAKERAEEAARKAWREQFDLASARAVAALPMLQNTACRW